MMKARASGPSHGRSSEALSAATTPMSNEPATFTSIVPQGNSGPNRAVTSELHQ